MAEFEIPGRLIVTEKITTSLRVYCVARKYVGSSKWSFDSNLHGVPKEDKCHMFVHDVLMEAGAKAPCTKPWFVGYSPVPPSEWGNRQSEKVLGTHNFYPVSIPMRGDIVAVPTSNGLDHVGIVSASGYYIGTSKKRIVETRIPTNVRRVFWRCK